MSLLTLGAIFAIITISLPVFAHGNYHEDDNYFFTPYHSPEQYAWAGNAETGYYKVYYAETSKDYIEILCSSLTSPQGCHTIIPVDDMEYHVVAVPLKGGYEYHKGLPGCNIYTHEMIHAWGYDESMMPHFWVCGEESLYLELPVLGVTKRG